MIITHTPVAQASQNFASSFKPFSNNQASGSHFGSVPFSPLHTSVAGSQRGFGAAEGKLTGGYEVNEANGDGLGQASAKAAIAYPYPFAKAHTDLLSGKAPVEVSYGFSPSIYDLSRYNY